MRRVLRDLRAADPHCHWCGCLTLDTQPPPFPKDMATVDHIKPRRECRTAKEYESPQNHVLACVECNILRDNIDLKRLAQLREREERVEQLKKLKPAVMVRTKLLGWGH
jgi:5-methylcytosine-specific restriction endonuclease McrA